VFQIPCIINFICNRSLGIMPRDKFAAMAQKQQEEEGAGAGGAEAEARAATSFSAASAAASGSPTAPKRDKFSAMASRSSDTASPTVSTSQPPRRDKFAALAAQSTSTTAPEQQQGLQSQEESQNIAQLRSRAQQREEVWNDLERAEADTLQVLRLAEKTTRLLSKPANPINSSNSSSNARMLREVSEQYASTVSRLHSRLSPHADLVRAYGVPSGRVHRTYVSRVRRRLAERRRAVLRVHLDLERREGREQGEEGRRTQGPTATTTTAPGTATSTEDDAKKRKREEE